MHFEHPDTPPPVLRRGTVDIFGPICKFPKCSDPPETSEPNHDVDGRASQTRGCVDDGAPVDFSNIKKERGGGVGGMVCATRGRETRWPLWMSLVPTPICFISASQGFRMAGTLVTADALDRELYTVKEYLFIEPLVCLLILYRQTTDPS